MSLFQNPGEKGYDDALAEVEFVHDLQLEVETLLESSGVSQRELADRMGVTEARVSQILSDDGANLQARTIARIARALGTKPRIQFSDTSDAPTRAVCMNDWVRRAGAAGAWARSAKAANDIASWEHAGAEDDVEKALAG